MKIDKNKPTKQQTTAAERRYPGSAINNADENKVNADMVKADVKSLNNNPRNNELDQ